MITDDDWLVLQEDNNVILYPLSHKHNTTHNFKNLFFILIFFAQIFLVSKDNQCILFYIFNLLSRRIILLIAVFFNDVSCSPAHPKLSTEFTCHKFACLYFFRSSENLRGGISRDRLNRLDILSGFLHATI